MDRAPRAGMVKKGQLEVSKMDSPRQGEDRDLDGPTLEDMRGHGSGAGTASLKRAAGSQSQRNSRPKSKGSSG
jgi:hypothetical protein